MEITDKKFLESYCNWCSSANLHAAKALYNEMTKMQDEGAKKALFIKIFFEFMQAGEHLLLIVDTIKKSDTLDGFHHRMTESKTQGDGFRYLWDDLNKFPNKKHLLFEYLGIPISMEDYKNQPRVYDGVYEVIVSSLHNRYGSEETGNSKLMKSYNKIKHGFTLFSDEDSDDIHIIHRQRTKVDGSPIISTEVITQKYDPDFALAMCRHLEGMRNVFMNICLFVLQSGIRAS